MGQLNIWVLFANGRHDLLPEHGHLQDIGLLHGAQTPIPLLRQLEGDVRNPLYLPITARAFAFDPG